MAETKYMVIDEVEELLDDASNVIGRLVTDKAGEQLKVKKGQGGKLEGRWEELDNGIGKAFEFTMGMFKPPGKSEGYPFVADFKEVKEIFVEQAVQKVANETRDLTRASIERQVSLKCATDVGVAILQQGGQTSPGDILDDADTFYNWLQGKEVQGETKTSDTSKSKGVEEIDEPEEGGREAVGEKPITAKELITWAAQYFKVTPQKARVEAAETWIKRTVAVDSITDKDAPAIYITIMGLKENWEPIKQKEE